MNFAQRLKTLRLQKGYTQEELAKMVNVTQPSYSCYERGCNLPYRNTQIQLAKILGVTVAELMLGVVNENDTECNAESSENDKGG